MENYKEGEEADIGWWMQERDCAIRRIQNHLRSQSSHCVLSWDPSPATPPILVSSHLCMCILKIATSA